MCVCARAPRACVCAVAVTARRSPAARRPRPTPRPPSPPSQVWDEMATFHIFGMIGNDWLYRMYEYIALEELSSHDSVADEPQPAEASLPTMPAMRLQRATPEVPTTEQLSYFIAAASRLTAEVLSAAKPGGSQKRSETPTCESATEGTSISDISSEPGASDQSLSEGGSEPEGGSEALSEPPSDPPSDSDLIDHPAAHGGKGRRGPAAQRRAWLVGVLEAEAAGQPPLPTPKWHHD